MSTYILRSGFAVDYPLAPSRYVGWNEQANPAVPFLPVLPNVEVLPRIGNENVVHGLHVTKGNGEIGCDSARAAVAATFYRAERYSAEEVAAAISLVPRALLQGEPDVRTLLAKCQMLSKALPRKGSSASVAGKKVQALVGWTNLPSRGEFAKTLWVLRWMLKRCPREFYRVTKENEKAAKRAAFEAATGKVAKLPEGGKKRRGR